MKYPTGKANTFCKRIACTLFVIVAIYLSLLMLRLNIRWSMKRRTLDRQGAGTGSRPVRVILLSYQRCGSSYVGQLFNQNPEAAYVFEPLDSFYVHLYGTQPGWNVPSDITHHWDGSWRTLPAREHEYLTRGLHSLLSCELDVLPAEFFIHKFWRQFPASLKSLEAFGSCLKKVGTNLTNLTACGVRLHEHCPARFGEDELKLARCYESLQHSAGGDITLRQTVEEYQNCTRGVRAKVAPCVELMLAKCRSSSIVGTKTVRLTMDTVERLLSHEPELKVIHLLRDPRPVALSRMSMASFRGHYSGNDMVLEAKLYCETVAHDIQVMKQLERRGYDETFKTIVYEQFASDPLTAVKYIYDFLGVSFPDEVAFWLKLKKNMNSTNIASSWQNKLTFKQSEQIKGVCENLFQLMNDIWL